ASQRVQLAVGFKRLICNLLLCESRLIFIYYNVRISLILRDFLCRVRSHVFVCLLQFFINLTFPFLVSLPCFCSSTSSCKNNAYADHQTEKRSAPSFFHVNLPLYLYM